MSGKNHNGQESGAKLLEALGGIVKGSLNNELKSVRSSLDKLSSALTQRVDTLEKQTTAALDDLKQRALEESQQVFSEQMAQSQSQAVELEKRTTQQVEELRQQTQENQERMTRVGEELQESVAGQLEELLKTVIEGQDRWQQTFTEMEGCTKEQIQEAQKGAAGALEGLKDDTVERMDVLRNVILGEMDERRDKAVGELKEQASQSASDLRQHLESQIEAASGAREEMREDILAKVGDLHHVLAEEQEEHREKAFAALKDRTEEASAELIQEVQRNQQNASNTLDELKEDISGKLEESRGTLGKQLAAQRKEIDTLAQSVTGLQMALQQQRDENARTAEVLSSLASVFGKQAGGTAAAQVPPRVVVAAKGKAGTAPETVENKDADLDAAIDKALDFG